MLMVVCVHIDGASLGLPDAPGLEACTPRDWWRLTVESFAIIGVNCFTMISGYFGIRLKVKAVVGYLYQCMFYALIVAAGVCILLPHHYPLSYLGESWMVLTHTDLWYVPAYFLLMLLAPLLNAGVEALSRRHFTLVLGAFTLFTLWAGWWWGGTFNPTGYTISQLIFVYLIGRYVRLYLPERHGTGPAIKSGICYLLFSLLILASALWLPSSKAFAYNSPAVLGSTVSLFLMFRSLCFQSRFINYVARSAFAVYLIHKSPGVWIHLMRPGVVFLYKTLPLPLFTLAALGIMLGIYAIAMAVDPLRRGSWILLSRAASRLKARYHRF